VLEYTLSEEEMKKRFKQIYIEITNICNLNCSFCPKTSRASEFMSYEKFQEIILKIKDYTEMVYFHVLGEPLLHDELKRMITFTNDNGLEVGITTNGVLLDKKLEIFKDVNVKRINVSLHSYYDKNNQLNDKQLYGTISACEKILENIDTTIFYRIWTMEDDNSRNISRILSEHYTVEFDYNLLTNPNGISLKHRVRLQQENQFVWPVEATEKSITGFCQGLRLQLAVLVNGDVVPCCLDSEGQIKLGNIHEEDLNDILNKDISLDIYNGFSNHQAIHPLCQKCNYKNRFSK